jgi:hypothetical protein
MALYLISYDIADKDAFEYQPLWDELKNIGAVRILYSEWVVKGDVNQSANIYEKLAPLTTMKDRLLVQELTNDAAWDKLLISDDAFRKLLASARG